MGKKQNQINFQKGPVEGPVWMLIDYRHGSWSRKILRATEKALMLFDTEQDTEPQCSVSLKDAYLREVTLTGALPPGVNKHFMGFQIKGRSSTSREESPRAVAEVSGSCLDLESHLNPQAPAENPVELVLAAEEIKHHKLWMSTLASLCESSSFVSTFDSFEPSDQTLTVSITSPPPALLKWLATSDQQQKGREMITRLHAARAGLISSYKETSILLNDPLQVVHPALNELQAFLLGLGRCLREDPTDDEASEDAESHAWLQQAATFAVSCTNAAYKAFLQDGGFGPGSQWSSNAITAAETVQQIAGAVLSEMAKHSPEKHCEGQYSNGNSSIMASGFKRMVTRPSALPYRTFWANKISI